jgi:hypothetical protein
MEFELGRPKTGGRKPGSKNKANANLRQFLTDFLEMQKETLHEDYRSLTARERIKAFHDLLKYVVPSLQATALEIDYSKLTDQDLDYMLERLNIKQ